MTPALLPANEAARLQALRALDVLDSEPEAAFDALVRAAAMVCGTPISAISLVDSDRQWFKATVGLPGAVQTPRDVAFCAHTILDDQIFEVPDALDDPRFADNPLVTGQPHVRFYAGAPLTLSDGSRVGALCVIGTQSGCLTPAQQDVLTCLAGAAAHALEGRHGMRQMRRLAGELAEQHTLLRVTLHSIRDGLITTDARGQITWMNPAAERLTGWTQEDAGAQCLGKVLRASHGPTGKAIEHFTGAVLNAEVVDTDAGQAVLLSAEGREVGIDLTASRILGDGGALQGLLVLFRDVTEQRRMSQEMNFRATHDMLTGLANRTELEARLQRAWLASQQRGVEHALMYVDLDRFKLVNDTCGHTAGDDLLRQVAGILRDAVRSNDLVARLGGDEFAILLEGCPMDKARRIAQALCDQMECFRFVHGDKRMSIGTSIGLVQVSARWKSPAAILQAADASCCAAKDNGRNRVHQWFETDQAMLARGGQADLAARIEEALDEDRFALFAQRIEPLKAKPGGVHAEVLLRMRDKDGSLIAPGAFLPAAERYQLATRIDRWVLRHSVAWIQARLLVEVPAQRLEQLSVNLSGQSVGDRAFHAWALELLTTAGEAMRHRLTLEITETAAVTHMADAMVFVQAVRKLGVRVALDDFGAGASSFGYLRTLTVDSLKIDGQFVRRLLDSPLDAAAVRCFVDVARVMGIETVAEFVDNPAVLERLRELKVDHAQGFLLHRPAPIDELFEGLGIAPLHRPIPPPAGNAADGAEAVRQGIDICY